MPTQLIYMSKVQAPMGGDLDRDILRVARRRNAELDVTGFLYRAPDTFLQLLEGDRDAVRGLMDLIRTDPRHTVTLELPTREAPSRTFPDWSMGYGRAGSDEIVSLAAGTKHHADLYDRFIDAMRQVAFDPPDHGASVAK